jgi:hypothetical protein
MKTKLKLLQISDSESNYSILKVLFVIIVLLFGFMQIQAQDIIVRTNSDTVFCKITSVDDTKIFFDFAKKDGKIINTFITRDEVKDFKYNVLPSAPEVEKKQESKPYSSSSLETLYSIGGGFAKAMGDGSEYINMGFSVNGDLFKKINNNVLIGGRLAYTYMSLNGDKLLEDMGYGDYDVSLEGNFSVFEIVPCIRFASSGPTSKFFGQVGFGYYMMKTKVTVSGGGESESNTESDDKTGLHLSVGVCLNQSSSSSIYLYPTYSRISTEGEATEFWSVNLCFMFGK